MCGNKQLSLFPESELKDLLPVSYEFNPGDQVQVISTTSPYYLYKGEVRYFDNHTVIVHLFEANLGRVFACNNIVKI